MNEYRNFNLLKDVHNGPRALSHNIRYLFDTITEEKRVYMTKAASGKKPNCELETDHLVPLKVIQERFNKLYAKNGFRSRRSSPSFAIIIIWCA